MPTLTRWFIKSALLYFLAALVLALLLALKPILVLPAVLDFMVPAYFHLFMVGWVTQMIFGVIFWMFPIITRRQPRGDVRLGWAAYLLLNAGLLLRIAAEPLNGLNAQGLWGWSLVLSAVLQWLAAFIFVLIAWPRIKEKYRGE